MADTIQNTNSISKESVVEQCKLASLEQLARTCADVDKLCSYIREIGKKIPDTALSDIKVLEDSYSKHEISSVSEILTLALSVHGILSELIYPVTVRSIIATDPNNKFFTSIKYNWSISLIFFLTFTAGLLVLVDGACGCSYIATDSFKNVLAAMAGAAFYSLFTAYSYIANRTFEPKYNNVYLARFVLGILSGSLLATIPLDVLGSYSPTVLAVVGGYSAEAVNQILMRISEMLVTLVKGVPKDDISQQASTIRTEIKNEKLLQQQRMANELNNLLKNAITSNAPEQTIADIKSSIESLTK